MKRTPLIRKKPLLRKHRISPVSKKRKAQMAIYIRTRADYLIVHPFCQATIKILGLDEPAVIQWAGYAQDPLGNAIFIPRSQDIHHTAGRTGTNYLDQSTWLAVCRPMHERIHNNPSWARQNGLLR
jgi:hypothetical protein